MKNIAIIPARSGSKGLPNKNIKIINGKHLIGYTIEAALESNLFDEIMVSTDSEEYAYIARQYGAKVPFLRSEQTASDEATTRECVLEVLNEYKERFGVCYDKLMILQPTSPLRDAGDIINAYRIFKEKKAKSVISVCEMEHSPLWCNKLPETGSLKNFISEINSVRRQRLESYFRVNGAIYLHDIHYYINHEYLFDDTAFAYKMDRTKSIDIDDEIDMKLAEFYLMNGSDNI